MAISVNGLELLGPIAWVDALLIAVALRALLVSAEEPEHILQSPEHVRAHVIRVAEAPRPGDHVEAHAYCAGPAR